MTTIGARLKHAWNAFVGQENTESVGDPGTWGSFRPGRNRSFISNERSIIASIYTRLAVDFSGMDIRHVRLDENDRYLENIVSDFNNCLTVEANLDQAASHFKQDIASSLFDRGVIAIVAVDTSINPKVSGGYDIQKMRVGTIEAWYPKHVRVQVYDERDGRLKPVLLPKSVVAIVENPFYSIMNEPNSTLQRLIRKLNLLDVIDEQSASGKLDIIIQLPYKVKSEAQRATAEQRLKDIEFQMKGSQYGIAYTDGTEKVIQLNRPAENNLLKQVEYLMAMLLSQLGITTGILDGTADEATMLNYYNRVQEPLLKAVCEAMIRTFLTKTARTQKQSIAYYRDPFKLVPISQIAEIADKFARNEIASSNDIRTAIGWKPSKDPKADKLVNSNMPSPSESGIQNQNN